MCYSGGLAQEVCVFVGTEDRARLAAIVGDRLLKHVQRCRIILFSADRLPVIEVARRAGVSRPAVWRWQRRYAEAGVEGLLRDKSRPPGKAPVAPATVAGVLALTCAEPPGETTHWTGRAMAKTIGLSLRTIQRIWEKHRLQPHRLRTFKRSTDPAFAEKVEDIVGLYMHPPAHAVVLSIDEKSQIQRCYGRVARAWHHRRCEQTRRGFPMPQVNDLSRCLAALDQDSTLIAVIEMSQSSWLVAGIVPGIERHPAKKLEPDQTALLRLLHPHGTSPWAEGSRRGRGGAGRARDQQDRGRL